MCSCPCHPLCLFSSFSKTHRWRVQVRLESLSHFLTSHLIALALGQFFLLIISVLISLSLQFTGLNFACHSGLTLWQGPWEDHHHHLLLLPQTCLLPVPHPPLPTCTVQALLGVLPVYMLCSCSPEFVYDIPYPGSSLPPRSLGQVLSFSTWPKAHPSLQLSLHHVAGI